VAPTVLYEYHKMYYLQIKLGSLIMMINNNYVQQVAQTKSTNALVLNLDKTVLPVQPIPGKKDTVTLSDKALAMME
jgi:hypothetical protein